VDLPSFHLLRTSLGQEALQAAEALQPKEVDFLAHFSALSRRFPAEMVRPALETAVLRLEAAAKFPFADQMYFTRPALEQATAYPVASYRAKRYRAFKRAADLGCSVGSDSLALAEYCQVCGLDLDPLRLEMARANLEALRPGSGTLFAQADLAHPLPLRPGPNLALFFDPARRSDSRRLFSVREYQPPLSILREWLPRTPALGVKISPGVKLEELASYQAELEFISYKGELKEAVLWFGPLASAHRRATLLPGPHQMTAAAPFTERLPVLDPQAYIYEPDPAVIRSGLVALLGLELGAAQLDPEIAYLTAPSRQDTPFARSWQVLDWLPFQLKRLRAYLRERGVGEVVVKKRGSPLQPERLIRDLRLSGTEQRILFLTMLRGRPVVLVCQ
jgi:SAM-dependent methyltransferase